MIFMLIQLNLPAKQTTIVSDEWWAICLLIKTIVQS